MITFIIGQRNAAFQKVLGRALSGAHEIERVRSGSENILRVMDDIQTSSLFGDKKTLVISNLLDDEDVKKLFFESGAALSKAPHDVVVIAESILAADLKKAESFATVHKILEKEKKASAFNAFALGNAFASGDKKQAWIILQQSLAAGDEAEKTHGLVWWKLKDLVQKKSAFTADQVRIMARNLVSAYHESRLGGLDLSERLELFFLNLPNKK